MYLRMRLCKFPLSRFLGLKCWLLLGAAKLSRWTKGTSAKFSRVNFQSEFPRACLEFLVLAIDTSLLSRCSLIIFLWVNEINLKLFFKKNTVSFFFLSTKYFSFKIKVDHKILGCICICVCASFFVDTQGTVLNPNGMRLTDSINATHSMSMRWLPKTYFYFCDSSVVPLKE